MWLQRLDLAGPLIVAPMAGGPTTPELVIACCQTGALGMLDGAYRSPEQLADAIARVRAQTLRPFGVNLFVPTDLPAISDARITHARRSMLERCRALGDLDAPLKQPYTESFDQQFATVLQHQPAILSFTFGLPKRSWIDQCHAKDIRVVGTATTLAEACALEDLGVDGIVAQGTEAGGHRGTFDAEAPEPGIDTLALCRQLSARLKVPFFAAGGMMTGVDMAAALKAGATAAQLGTAFLLCPEAGTSKPYRDALVRRPHAPTVLTRAFSGRSARGLENAFVRAMRDEGVGVLPFPAQNTLTNAMRRRSVVAGSSDYLSLWAGTGYPALQAVGAEHLVRTLLRDASTHC